MSSRDETRLDVIALGLWLAVILVSFPASAQQSPLQPLEEPVAAEASPELAEVERKTREVQERLEEWQAKAAEYLLAGQGAPARTAVIDEEIARLQQRDAIAIPLGASARRARCATTGGCARPGSGPTGGHRARSRSRATGRAAQADSGAAVDRQAATQGAR